MIPEYDLCLRLCYHAGNLFSCIEVCLRPAWLSGYKHCHATPYKVVISNVKFESGHHNPTKIYSVYVIMHKKILDDLKSGKNEMHAIDDFLVDFEIIGGIFYLFNDAFKYLYKHHLSDFNTYRIIEVRYYDHR